MRQAYIDERRGELDSAQQLYQKVLTIRPDQADAERGLDRSTVLVERQQQQQELRDLIDQLDEAEMWSATPQQDAWLRAKALTGVILERLPVTAQQQRVRALRLRSEIDRRLVEAENVAQAERAAAHLAQSQSLLDLGQQAQAREELGQARSLVPNSPEIEVLVERLAQAEAEAKSQDRLLQAELLVFQAQQAITSEQPERALSLARAAVALSPQDNIEQSYEDIFQQVFEFRQVKANAERQAAADRAVARTQELLALGQWRAAAAMIEQMRESGTAPAAIDDLAQQVTAAELQSQQQVADGLLDQVTELSRQWRDLTLQQRSLEESYRRLEQRVAGRLPLPEQAQQLRQLKEQIAERQQQQLGFIEQITALLHRAQQLLPQYNRLQQAMLEHYRERMELALERGARDEVTALASIGRQYDVDNRYRTLWEQQALIHAQHDMTLRSGDQQIPITAGSTQSVSAQAYTITAPNRLPLALKLMAGQEYHWSLPPNMSLPHNMLPVVQIDEMGSVNIPFVGGSLKSPMRNMSGF